jgi:hypothetical protein
VGAPGGPGAACARGGRLSQIGMKTLASW